VSPEAALLARPATAWPQIAKLPPSRHCLARPLFALFVYGCAMSLAATGRVTARIVAPAMVYACFAPLLQMAALVAVGRSKLPFRRAVDLFFAGHAPVSLLWLAFGTAWTFVPPATMYDRFEIWNAALLAALA
jgi:hypothetical protein